MSEKRLDRVVIERGRRKGNKWDRRHSNREERSYVRAYLSKAYKDEEFTYTSPLKERRWVMKEFNDHLAPAYKWLNKQVGRPWAMVRSELFQMVDTKTISGRHVAYDHLLRDIAPHPYVGVGKYFGIPYDYVVDDEGILRHTESYFRRNQYRKKPEQGYVPKEQEFTAWLNGRLIIERGSKLFWTESAKDLPWYDCKDYRCNRIHRKREYWENYQSSYQKVPRLTQFSVNQCQRGALRQTKELSKKDQEFFRSLTKHWQDRAKYVK